MCPEKYISNGDSCNPLRIEITYEDMVIITCEAYHVYHEGVGPSVIVYETENVTQLRKDSKTEYGMVTDAYVFAFKNHHGESGCPGESDERGHVKFRIYHPMRGFHNQGSGKDTEPFHYYDSSNVDCTVSVVANCGNSSDGNSKTLGSVVNDDTNNHLPTNIDGGFLTVVVDANGQVSAKFEEE